MSLSINTNLMAMNASRNLTGHYARMSSSIRRLSSGLRVSSAADDAAGLAIRELMRSDIASLNQGIRNANDAISMIQTADGALGIIDEKLIRMKELAEQAATGTYNSDQRLMIDSEFQAMAAEIERIATATDFNGVKLLDGSLSGAHNGAGLTSTGAMKIHFGTGNDAAEDYYYVDIGDCTLSGLGLGNGGNGGGNNGGAKVWEASLSDYLQTVPTLNDCPDVFTRAPQKENDKESLTNIFAPNEQGEWFDIKRTKFQSEDRYLLTIPKGTKNLVINLWGTDKTLYDTWGWGDNDIQLFTKDGVHLAGTPLTDYTFNVGWWATPDNFVNETGIDANSADLGFTEADYDGSNLNSGPAQYDPSCQNLAFSLYNGMTIGYSGDPDRHETQGSFGRDKPFNDGYIDQYDDYEVLFIDETTEDLLVYFPGKGGSRLQVYWDLPTAANKPAPPDLSKLPAPNKGGDGPVSIKTQAQAQQALEKIDNAIIKKDKIRAHLGALQNRFENTASNLRIQAENMQSAESRISDADVSLEMTEFTRSQILTQASTAMLTQANSLPKMLMRLLEG